MTRLARVDMYAVAPLLPGDKVAGRIAARGEHFEWEPSEGHVHSDTPIATRSVSARELNDPHWIDLTGMVVDRLTVVGLAASSPEQRRWVVRCRCGSYGLRKSKYIRRCISGDVGQDHDAMCGWCVRTKKLQQGYHDPKKAAAAAEAIMEAAR